MAKNKDIRVQEFSMLRVTKACLGKLSKGSWVVNQDGLKELVIDCNLSSKKRGYSLKTLAGVGGHIKIIQERFYEGMHVDPEYMLFARTKSEKFIKGNRGCNRGYEERSKIMERHGYDMSKLGGER